MSKKNELETFLDSLDFFKHFSRTLVSQNIIEIAHIHKNYSEKFERKTVFYGISL